MSAPAVIIDAHGLAHRAWGIASRAPNPLAEATGTLCLMLRRILTELQPARIGAVFEAPSWGSDGNPRKIWHPGYKAHRPERSPELLGYLGAVPHLMSAMGIMSAYPGSYEADDGIYTLAMQTPHPPVIVSADRDFWALLGRKSWDGGEGIRCWSPALSNGEGRSKGRYVTPADVYERYPFAVSTRDPLQLGAMIRLCHAVAGDAADGIPGAKGVGPAGAAQLAEAFGSLAALMESFRSDLPPAHLSAPTRRVWAKARASQEAIALAAKLTDLYIVQIHGGMAPPHGINSDRLRDIGRKWGWPQGGNNA